MRRACFWIGLSLPAAMAFAAFAQPVNPAPPRLSIRAVSDQSVRLAWSKDAGGFLLEATDRLSPVPDWQPVALLPQLEGDEFAVTVVAGNTTRFFRLRQEAVVALTTITETSPADGETGVAVTRETIVHFSLPLSASAVLTTNHFYATFGGRRILSRIELSTDRRTATLFYPVERLPGSARINVFFDSEGLTDFLGRPLDPSGSGKAGGFKVIRFDTLSLTPLAGTAVIGRVFASELQPGPDTGTNAVNRPLEGVTITLDGAEQDIRTRTDAMGNFKLDPVPPGRFFVKIDGRTVTNLAENVRYPDLAYYPYVGKAWEAVAGRADNKAGGTGEIFLPLIKPGTLQKVSLETDTTITFPAEVVAANPALRGVSITVPANALFADDGTRGGKVGIAPVPPDRLPGPLPPGLEFDLVITVQTDGALNFDKPVPICFPNLPDPVLGVPLPANSRQALISFNHKKGVWEAVGSMTVSADGRFVCTDPGSGILQPGWHGKGRDPKDPDPCPGGCCQKPPPPPPPPPPGPAGLQAVPLRSMRPRATPNAQITLAGLKTQRGSAVQPDTHGASVLGAVPPPGPGGGQCKPCPNDTNDRAREICHELCEAKFERCQLKCTLIFLAGWGSCPLAFKIHCTGFYTAWNISCNQNCADEANACDDACDRQFPKCDPTRPQKAREAAAPGASGAELVQAQGADPILDRIVADVELAVSLLRPYHVSRSEVPADVAQQVTALFAEADAIAGGDALSYVRARVLEHEDKTAALEAENGPGIGNAPAYPILYFAEVARPNGGVLHLRGETGPFGDYALFVPSDGTLLFVSFYDPRTKQYGSVTPRLRPDVLHELPRFYLHPLPPDAPDFDNDGLPDALESIYGTDTSKSDSDGDGLPDGAEVEQGTNPLDGLPAQTGIIATAKTPGPAVDVCAVNNLAVVAELNQGVSVFNVFNGMNPIIVAQVDTPGKALRVACEGSLIAVADEGAGLAVIDITDPAAARVGRQVGVGAAATAVAAGAGVAYVGTSAGLVVAVDMATGAVLNRVALNGGVEDLALAGNYLYALTADRLAAVSVAYGALSVTGVADSPVVVPKNRRLFVGGGIAYVTHPKGYNTFDLADPAKPVLIKASNTEQFGWKQIVANGSGLGVAAVGLNLNEDPPNDVWLFDVRDPGKTDLFLTAFPTPGTARAVSIFNGLAYVADDTAGLQVINYLAYDAKGQPPAISLTTGAPNNLVEEGKPLRATATVTDDVQVRSVEFYFDGQLAQTDGNFPFEFHFNAPPLTTAKTSFRLRARAVDTGGNAAWSEEIIVNLADDLTPPTVTHTTPYAGSARELDTLFTYIDEPIDPATLTPDSFQLFAAGPDGLPGTPDDLRVLGGSVRFRNELNAATLSFAVPLAQGRYRAVLASSVADLAGNRLAGEYAWDFRLADAVFWISPESGLWHAPIHWSTGAVPGPGEAVIIDVPGDIRVSFSEGTSAIKSLLSEEAFELSGGTLEAAGTVQVNNEFVFTRSDFGGAEVGPTLLGAIVLAGTDPRPIVVRGGKLAYFDGVTLNAPLLVESTGRLRVRNGLALNNALTLDEQSGGYTALEFLETQTLTGNGEIRLPGFNHSGQVRPISGTLIIAPGITIHGRAGKVGDETLPLINQGRIVADTPPGGFGRGILVVGSPFDNRGIVGAASEGLVFVRNLQNAGTATASSKGSVVIDGSWTNGGVLSIDDARLSLGGTFTVGALGMLQRTGGTVVLFGILENTGRTLNLDANSGSWRIEDGRINGGTVTATEGASLVVSGGRAATLDGVTLSSDVMVEPGGRIVAVNGLTLNGTLTLDERSGAYTALEFSETQALSGTGEIVLPGFNQSGQVRPLSGTLTIGPDITIHGRAGTVGSAALPLVNQGRIIADTPLGGFGRGILVVASTFDNRGTVGATSEGLVFVRNLQNAGTAMASSQGSVVIDGNWTNGGAMTIDDARMSLGGTFTVGALGSVQRTGGTVVLSGVLDNIGTTLSLDASTGSWRVEDGRINGGTVAAKDGASLVVGGGRSATMDGVTLNSDVTVEAGGRVVAVNGLTLNGTLTLDERSGAYTALEFSDTQTLAGTGQVVFTGLNPSGTVQPTSGTLTIGAGITIRGGTGTLGNRNLPLVNEGTISADVAGRTIFVLANPFTNNGTVQELNGGSVLINP